MLKIKHLPNFLDCYDFVVLCGLFGGTVWRQICNVLITLVVKNLGMQIFPLCKDFYISSLQQRN